MSLEEIGVSWRLMESEGTIDAPGAPSGGLAVAPEVDPYDYGHDAFQGTVRAKVEASGRLPIPAAFKYAFADAAIVRARRDQCLQLFTPRGFDAMVDYLEELQGGTLDPATRVRFYKFAPRLSVDRQSRLVLPEDLRRRVGIEEDIVMAGSIEAIEIWPADRFEEVEAPRSDEMDLLLDGHRGLPSRKRS